MGDEPAQDARENVCKPSRSQGTDDAKQRQNPAVQTQQRDTTDAHAPRQLDAGARQQEYWDAWETSIGVTETNNAVLIRDATLVAEGKQHALSQVGHVSNAFR
eukprot:8353419-Pyramimonas_sp.AAC.1